MGLATMNDKIHRTKEMLIAWTIVMKANQLKKKDAILVPPKLYRVWSYAVRGVRVELSPKTRSS